MAWRDGYLFTHTHLFLSPHNISLSSLQHAPLLYNMYRVGILKEALWSGSCMQPLNILNIDFSATRVSRRHPTSHLHGGGCELILSVNGAARPRQG